MNKDYNVNTKIKDKIASTERKIIDCHQHVNFHGYDADKLINHMNNLGAEKSWLLTWESIDGSLEPRYQHLSIEDVWMAHEKYPDRFIPFYAPDPRREDVEERLKKWVKKGIKGYGEHKVRIRIDNPDSIRIYNLCSELKLPVLFHMDVSLPTNPRFWYNMDMDGLEKVLKECHKTTFIAHGPGWWRYISGDAEKVKEYYPKDDVKEGGKVIKLLEKYPNLYGDISAYSGLNALTRDEEFGVDFINKFYKKLLYGTDYHDSKHLEYFLKGNKFSDKVLDSILWNNAETLIKY